MGHDHHFLSRLDRVASGEVELALSLYRDHVLVRQVLSFAKLPENADRIAISLADPEKGPFIVVARDGGFVTCLAQGMSKGSLPVITRNQLDAISGRVQKLKEGLQMAVTLTGGRVDKLLTRIFTAGPTLTREEVIAISAIEPLLSRHFLPLLLDCASEVHHARIALRNVEKPRHRDERLVVRAWGSLWAIGHLVVFYGMGGRERFDELDPRFHWIREEVMPLVFQQCVFALSLRGVWAASKIGKPLLPIVKRELAQSKSFLGMVSSAAALNAIAYGHSRLRAEAKKALTLPALPEMDLRSESLNQIRLAIRDTIEETDRDAHEAEKLALSWGKAAAFRWLNQPSLDSPHQYRTAEDVPDDIAREFTSWHFGHSGQANADMDAVFKLTPWIVKQRAENLFLPAELMNAIRFPQVPSMAHELIQRPFQAYWLKVPTPARAPQTPGRNEPCKCGSGRKYKRCCG